MLEPAIVIACAFIVGILAGLLLRPRLWIAVTLVALYDGPARILD